MKTRIRGNRGEYRLEELITQGNMSWSIRATDVANRNARIFLKYYMSPTPKVPWFEAYVDYVKEINRRLQESRAAQYCVLCKDLFVANPRPGMCRDEYLYQAFEFIEGGNDLRNLMDKGDLPWDKRVTIAMVFLVSMRNIHEARVVHCDLKPENIQMVPNPTTSLGLIPRMIDMDRSILEDQPAPWTQGENPEGYTGTPGYMSPEHFNGKVPRTASDVFTVGLILSELLAGTRPFDRYASQEEYRDAILAGGKFKEVHLLGELGGSKKKADEFARMIESCFNPNPTRRPSCKELHRKLLELNRSETSPDSGARPRSEAHPSEAPSLPREEPTKRPPEGKKTGTLRLEGDAGTRDFRLDTDVGRDMLSKVSSQARFCARAQFRVERKDGVWYIRPVPGTPNLTAVNGTPISGATAIAAGDCISLIGQVSKKQAMPIKVAFV